MALREELKSQGDFLFKYRSYFPLILLLAGLTLIFIYEQKGGADAVSGYRSWLEDPAIFVSLLGFFLRVYAVGYSGKHTSGRNTSDGQVAHVLNTKGLYSIVRNPLYMGNYFMWLGIAMLTCNLWFIGVFTVIFWIYYERIVFAEEEFLRKEFGEDYLKWAASTPVFIPYKFTWQKPDTPFLFRKVIKQEKNGFVALFFIFFLFEVFQNRITEQQWVIHKTWLLVMFIISATAYILIKILRNKF